MNKNEKFVITINRELGSGGRTVGRLLAEKLDVPYYDKAVIQARSQLQKIAFQFLSPLGCGPIAYQIVINGNIKAIYICSPLRR